jgi:hypothetical protein
MVSALGGGARDLLVRRRLTPRTAARVCEIWSALPSGHHAAPNQALGLELRRPPTDFHIPLSVPAGEDGQDCDGASRPGSYQVT